MPSENPPTRRSAAPPSSTSASISSTRDRLREALRPKGVPVDEGQGDWLAVQGTTLEVVGDTAAEHGIPVYELYRQSQSLEDVFLELTQGTEAGR